MTDLSPDDLDAAARELVEEASKPSRRVRPRLARKLADGEKSVNIFGEAYEVRANVQASDGYSAHADQEELLAWADPLDRTRLQHLFLVHGEPAAAAAFMPLLAARGFNQVSWPERGQSFEF